MAAVSILHIPIPAILIAFVVVYALQRIYYELTTGARRRQMIKDNGCEEVVWYPHKGILGNLYGLDVIKDMIKSGKEGRLHEASRLRNFGDGKKTVKVKLARNTGPHTPTAYLALAC